MKIAVIDMGTNTFHLLIASVQSADFKVLYKEKTAVRIGKGGISEGRITQEAEKRALKALRRFRETIDIEKVDKVFATATSAIRNAINGLELIKRIKEQTDINVRVISGNQEAEFIYGGVRKALDLGKGTSLIMDIGGGSIEFIIGNQKDLLWRRSFEIGGQRLIDKFHKNDPITTEEIKDLEDYLDDQLTELFITASKYDINTLVGSSGTFDTLSDIYRMKQDLEKSPDTTEFPLPMSEYPAIVEEIIAKNRSARLEIPGMIPLRVDMIVVAVVLINFIINKLQLSNIRVSAYALKEGVLLDILEQLCKEEVDKKS